MVEALSPSDVLGIISEDPSAVLVLDTETTGLDPECSEVLELSIIDGSGRVIHSKRYGTIFNHEWPEAQRVNGISPEDVRGLPSIIQDVPKIRDILRGARVLVGYNLSFDLAFLRGTAVNIPRLPQCDVMKEFATVYGEPWHEGGFKWQRLTTACAYYGMSTEGAHGSLWDARATLEVLKRISAGDPPKGSRPIGADVVRIVRDPSRVTEFKINFIPE